VEYQGHQIFIVHPDPELCRGLVRSLRRSEYEAYGFSGLDTDVSVMQRDTVVFLYVAEDTSWDWQDFLSRLQLLEITLHSVALGSPETPEGFDYGIEASDESALEPILAYLEEISARGHRHYVRFGSQYASIATFNFHHEERLYAGVIHDLSSTGMSCTFKPEPENLGHMEVANLNLNIHGYCATLSGSFTSSRMVAGQIIHVFNFSGDIPDDALDHIYDFIYSSLETKLSLH
jgi:hypothetical protein